jgi:hypothetical protein
MSSYPQIGFSTSSVQIKKGTETISPSNNYDNFIENLAIYPNPVVDQLKVSFKSNNQGIVVVSLFNTIGKQVFRQENTIETGNNIISINIKNYLIEPGIYFVKIEAETEIFTRKLIVK